MFLSLPRYRRLAMAGLLAIASAAGTAQARTVSTLEHLTRTLTEPRPQTSQFAAGSTYTLCFVPDGPSCQDMIVDAIHRTRRQLLIQAYSFTNKEIAKAVVEAHQRGVDVRVIVDKSQSSERYTSATFLKNAGIAVVIDTKPAIAHNKVMVFDEQAVFTGSFNFTKSAEERNAENGMLIRGDSAVVKAYSDNWRTRYGKSSAY
ncbi:phospholipase D family protein [Cupriavidus sp. SW-Y-13]|nr:phospholipase D family protein [Cupriavidus sp. SW-Y-13]